MTERALGQWPVIFLSLKKVEGNDYATARRRLVSTVVDCAQSLDFLLESPKDELPRPYGHGFEEP